MSERSRPWSKITPDVLGPVLAASAPDSWVFLNAPISNPTGSGYSVEEISDLVRIARAAGARVVLDAIFAGLGHHDSSESHSIGFGSGQGLVLLGGLAKIVAAGGLRFGFATTHDPEIATLLRGYRGGTPHWTLRYTAKILYRDLVLPDSQLAVDLEIQRRTLADRARRLSECLGSWGWEVLPPVGGLFLVAKPTAYLGRSHELVDDQGQAYTSLDGDGVAEALFRSTGLLINGPTWTGIPEQCRFVLSVTERDFELALERIADFGRQFGLNPG